MAAQTRPGTVREAVGYFGDAEALQAAIDDLLSSGFDRAELSLLASEESVEAKLHHKYRKVSELEDDASVPRESYVSTESVGDAEGSLIGGLFYVGAVAAAGAIVASGGTLAAVIAGAAMAGGTGSVIGALLAGILDEEHANRVQEQLDRGGLLLWVHARDGAHETRAVEILRRHSGQDVHVHEIQA